jgi:hypothetical protein
VALRGKGVVKVVTRDKADRAEISVATGFLMIAEDLVPEMGANSFVIMKARR